MPLKTHINGGYVRRNSHPQPTTATYQKMRDLLTQRLADLDREAERIAHDKKRLEEYLRTLPNP